MTAFWHGCALAHAAIRSHDRRLSGGSDIVAAISETPVTEKILKHLWLQAQSPPQVPAREAVHRIPRVEQHLPSDARHSHRGGRPRAPGARYPTRQQA